jgi:hypothetical protein
MASASVYTDVVFDAKLEERTVPQLRFGYSASLDGLRALAVLVVMGYHHYLQFLPGGNVGVDVFFVLSGFLITSLLFEASLRTIASHHRRFCNPTHSSWRDSRSEIRGGSRRDSLYGKPQSAPSMTHSGELRFVARLCRYRPDHFHGPRASPYGSRPDIRSGTHVDGPTGGCHHRNNVHTDHRRRTVQLRSCWLKSRQ